MFYLLICIVAVILALTILLLIRKVSLLKIRGTSMYPTFNDGQTIFAFRKFSYDPTTYESVRDSIKGRIIVAISPDVHPDGKSVIVIKRIVSTASTTSGVYVWLEGDNKEHSRDSRDYGWVHESSIIAEVFPTWKETIKQLLKG